jgi:hypothetical protein
MPDDTHDERLGRFARGELSADEQRALYEAALEDQALFDELAAEEALRDVLADPGARAAVQARLREARPVRRPRWIAPLAAAASIAVAAVGAFHLLGGRPDLVGMAGRPTQETAALWRESDEAPAGKGLGLDVRLSVGAGTLGVGRFRPREEMHIAVLPIGSDVDVAVLLQPPDGAARPLDPPGGSAMVRVRAGEPHAVLAVDGRPPLAPSVPGTYRLRLLAFEAGRPPATGDAVLLRARLASGAVTIADTRIEVAP